MQASMGVKILNSPEATLLAIILLIILLSLRVKLYYVLGVVPIIIALLYGGLDFLVTIVINALLDHTTIGLVFSVFIVSLLVSMYVRSNIVYRLSEELSKLFRSDLATITLVPGVIGLLPVPGGALMSAPIVDVAGSRLGLSKDKKLFINVWYRHIIVYVYPLSSIIILASAVTGVNLWMLLLAQIPVAVLMFLCGLPFVGLKSSKIEKNADTNLVARGMIPIISSIILAILLSPLDYILKFERISVGLAVLISIPIFIILNKLKANIIMDSLRDNRIWEITLISLEVMILRELFLSMDLKPIANMIINIGFSREILALIIPILFSIIAGHPTAGIAIATPIIASITSINLSLASIIYASAFIGYIASPLHLCYLYTAQYYRISIIEGYKYMIPVTLASLIAATIISTHIPLT